MKGTVRKSRESGPFGDVEPCLCPSVRGVLPWGFAGNAPQPRPPALRSFLPQGVEFFDEKLNSLCMAWLVDHGESPTGLEGAMAALGRAGGRWQVGWGPRGAWWMLEPLSMPSDAHLDRLIPLCFRILAQCRVRGARITHHQGLPTVVSSPRATEPTALALNPPGYRSGVRPPATVL